MWKVWVVSLYYFIFTNCFDLIVYYSCFISIFCLLKCSNGPLKYCRPVSISVECVSCQNWPLFQSQITDQRFDVKVSCGLLLVPIVDFLGLNDTRFYKWHTLQSENVFHHLKGLFKNGPEAGKIWISYLQTSLTEGVGAAETEQCLSPSVSAIALLIYPVLHLNFNFYLLLYFLDSANLCLNRKAATASATCSNMADFHHRWGFS